LLPQLQSFGELNKTSLENLSSLVT